MVNRTLNVVALACLLPAAAAGAGSGNRQIGVNVLLRTDPSAGDPGRAGRARHGRDVLVEIDAVTLKTTESELAAIRALPYVIAANPDAVRNGSPVDTVSATNFANGINTWDLDAVDVTNFGVGRTSFYDGSGVYVAVLDTGLLDTWRQYFPQERIATEFAKAFNGGGGENGNVSEPTNKWEHDQNSHGTHVTSTVLGYSFSGVPVNGVAPQANVIPVKVLNQNGSGWSSVVARGIVYIADLKADGALGDAPVVINMSLGGPVLDAVERAAIDYAISQGVVIVAAAGNAGTAGMGFPGAYRAGDLGGGIRLEWPMAAGQRRQSEQLVERRQRAGPDRSRAISTSPDFSSRELPGQDLDVAAPGSWTVGPYQLQSGKTSYFFLGGTSMASPHVAGIAALMLQKNPVLEQTDVEGILETAAIPLAAGCAALTQPGGAVVNTCWGDDATGEGLITAEAALSLTP